MTFWFFRELLWHESALFFPQENTRGFRGRSRPVSQRRYVRFCFSVREKRRKGKTKPTESKALGTWRYCPHRPHTARRHFLCLLPSKHSQILSVSQSDRQTHSRVRTHDGETTVPLSAWLEDHGKYGIFLFTIPHPTCGIINYQLLKNSSYVFNR